MPRSEVLFLLLVGDRVSHFCHCLPGVSSPSPPGPRRLFPQMSLARLICEIVAARRGMSVRQRVRAARLFTVVPQLTDWILKECLQKADWNA